jgi:hypothetical protein
MDRLCEGPWSECVAHLGDQEFHSITDQALVEAFLAAL